MKTEPVVTRGIEWSKGNRLPRLPLIRRCKLSSSGWNSGDIDVAFQLFRCGMVWDGNLSSKDGRDHLVAGGYAVRHEGMQAMTGKGTVAFLLSTIVWRAAFRYWRLWHRNPFIATPDRVREAMR